MNLRTRCSILVILLLGACSEAPPASEPDAGRAQTLALARAQIAKYRYQPPADAGERCFDLKVIVRTFRSAQAAADQAKWQVEMDKVCRAAGKTADL